MEKPMGEVKQLDQRMNEMGYLRLMVNAFLVMNMSNSPVVNQQLMLYSSKEKRSRNLLLDQPLVKKIMLKICDKIFERYYKSNQ